MPYALSHFLVRRNAYGMNTRFRLYRKVASGEIIEPQNLPLIGDVEIKGKVSDNRTGIYSYRASVNLLNGLDGDFFSYLSDGNPQSMYLTIEVQTQSKPYEKWFVGLLDPKYAKKSLLRTYQKITLNFISGLSTLSNIDVNDKEDLGSSWIRTVLDEGLRMNFDVFLTELQKEVCLIDNADVYYAYDQIGFEFWRYFKYPQPNANIPDPNVVFAEIFFLIQKYNGKDYSQLLNDFCDFFFVNIGYSQKLQSLCCHHLLVGYDSADYTLHKTEELSLAIKEVSAQTRQVQILDVSRIHDKKLFELYDKQYSLIEIDRPGAEGDGFTYPVYVQYKNRLNRFGSDYKYSTLYDLISSTDLIVLNEPAPNPLSFPEALGRMQVNDSDLVFIDNPIDSIDFLASWRAVHFFANPTGIEFTTDQHIDPMLPFSYDGDVYRVYESEQNTRTMEANYKAYMIGPSKMNLSDMDITIRQTYPSNDVPPIAIEE